MDGSAFDDLLRVLARSGSRRGLLGLLSGLPIAGGLVGGTRAEARPGRQGHRHPATTRRRHDQRTKHHDDAQADACIPTGQACPSKKPRGKHSKTSAAPSAARAASSPRPVGRRSVAVSPTRDLARRQQHHPAVRASAPAARVRPHIVRPPSPVPSARPAARMASVGRWRMAPPATMAMPAPRPTPARVGSVSARTRSFVRPSISAMPPGPAIPRQVPVLPPPEPTATPVAPATAVAPTRRVRVASVAAACRSSVPSTSARILAPATRRPAAPLLRSDAKAQSHAVQWRQHLL
jgi:hypothetical protein